MTIVTIKNYEVNISNGIDSVRILKDGKVLAVKEREYPRASTQECIDDYDDIKIYSEGTVVHHIKKD